MLNRLGAWVVRYRLWVIAAWVLLLFPSLYGLSQLPQVLQGEAATSPGTEANQQEVLLNEDFPEQNIYGIDLVIISETESVASPVYQALLQSYLDVIRAHEDASEPLTYQQEPSQLSADRKKTFLSIGLLARNLNDADVAAKSLSEQLKAIPVPEGFTMYLTGGPLYSHEITTVSAKDGIRTEKRVLPMILILLILAFGGIVAAGLPLLVGVFAGILSLGLLFVIAHYMPITSLSQNLITMLGLGVGIDYSLLYVNRFREEIYKGGRNKEEAAIATLESAGRTILYSGTVVSIGLLALLVPNVMFMRSLGVSGLLVVAMTVLISLTLMPALLSLLGKKINFPYFLSNWTYRTWGKRKFWYRWARQIMARPLFFSVVSIGVLVSFSILTFEMKVWSPTIQIMPESLETRKGFEEIIKIKPQNTFAPIVITFKSKDGSPIWTQDNVEAAYHFMTAVNNQEAVAGMIGLVNANQPLADHLTLYNTVAASGGIQTMRLFQPGISLPFISSDETKGVIAVFHEHEGYEMTDYDARTIKQIRDYRDMMAEHYPNLEILVGGLSAIPLEMKEAIFSHFPMIVLFTVVVTYLLTMFSFGSLLLPLKAVVLNILSVTATYGCMILVFQKGIGASLLGIEQVPGALMIVSPLILFCVIFGLSMDYEIFLINRIREEYDACGDPEEAIAQGMEKTGGIITNAAVIMILVFMGFAFARLIVIKEFGFGLAVAIFIDATIIRLMVVPALMKLFGHASWYFPKALDIPVLRQLLKD